jgi:hypothetical protein
LFQQSGVDVVREEASLRDFGQIDNLIEQQIDRRISQHDTICQDSYKSAKNSNRTRKGKKKQKQNKKNFQTLEETTHQ